MPKNSRRYAIQLALRLSSARAMRSVVTPMLAPALEPS
jgi:hypothetical protein